METTRKRRGSLLKNMFASSSPSTHISEISPKKKVRAEIGLTNTTLRMLPSPDESKPTFTVFQTRMLKLVDSKDSGAESGPGVRYVPVEAPKLPIPSIKITKADGIPFILREEGLGDKDVTLAQEGTTLMEIDVEYDGMGAGDSTGLFDDAISFLSNVSTRLPTPPESPVDKAMVANGNQVGFTRSRPRVGSLSRTMTIKSRGNSLSMRSGIPPKVDSAADRAVEERNQPRRVHFELPSCNPQKSSPPSPPSTPPTAAVPVFADHLKQVSSDVHTPERSKRLRRKNVPQTRNISSDGKIIIGFSGPLKPSIKLDTSSLPGATQANAPVEVTIPPGSIIGGDIHPYFRRYDKELPLPPIRLPDEKELNGSVIDDDDVSSVSSLDSFSSMSSFSTGTYSIPWSEEGNDDSIIGTRDSTSTYRDSWLTSWSANDGEEKEKERVAQEARMRRMRQLARDFERRGGGGGTLKWGGMDIGELERNTNVPQNQIRRKPVGVGVL